MSLAAALVAGGLIGIRHAFEPDHLAAIATLVDADDDAAHPGRVGASWGVGHSLPILLIGLLFVLVGIRLPAGITALFEVAVGVVLVYLGARMLYETAEPAIVRHGHDAAVDDGTENRARVDSSARPDHDHDHDHEHGAAHTHRHLRVGGLSLGRTHGHVDDASFLVGVLHGLAGSGALVIALVSAAPSVPSAVAFLAAFSVLSIVTMGGVSYLWGRSLERGFANALEAVAGVMGIGVGLLLLADHLLGVAVF